MFRDFNARKLIYALYIESDIWRRRRQRILALAQHKCEFPGCEETKGLQIHHITYVRLGFELDGDLVALCKFHHALVHAHWPKYRSELRAAIEARPDIDLEQDQALERLAEDVRREFG